MGSTILSSQGPQALATVTDKMEKVDQKNMIMKINLNRQIRKSLTIIFLRETKSMKELLVAKKRRENRTTIK